MILSNSLPNQNHRNPGAFCILTHNRSDISISTERAAAAFNSPFKLEPTSKKHLTPDGKLIKSVYNNK
jgi:hypothetical protein